MIASNSGISIVRPLAYLVIRVVVIGRENVTKLEQICRALSFERKKGQHVMSLVPEGSSLFFVRIMSIPPPAWFPLFMLHYVIVDTPRLIGLQTLQTYT